MRIAFLLLTASLILPASVQAQRKNELKNGVHVELTESYGATIKGRIVSVSADSVTLVAGPGPTYRTIALRDTRSIKVRHANHGRGLFMGALIGTAAGALSGAILGMADDSCDILSCGRSQNAAFGAAVLGTLGLGVGSLFGVAAGWPEWKTITLGGR